MKRLLRCLQDNSGFKTIITFSFALGVVATGLTALSFQKKEFPKTYTVTKSLPEWQGDADTLAYIQVKIGYPMAKAEGDIYQAALGRILKNQYDQIILQLSKEQEEQRKKDSTTNAVKPKTK